MKYEDRTFTAGETVQLDDNEYVNCQFIGCTLRFAGGKFSITGCGFGGAFSLRFDGLACNTLLLLQTLCTLPAGRDYIVGMLDPRNTALNVMR